MRAQTNRVIRRRSRGRMQRPFPIAVAKCPNRFGRPRTKNLKPRCFSTPVDSGSSRGTPFTHVYDSSDCRHRPITTEADIFSCVQGQDHGPVRSRAYENHLARAANWGHDRERWPHACWPSPVVNWLSHNPSNSPYEKIHVESGPITGLVIANRSPVAFPLPAMIDISFGRSTANKARA